MLVRGALFAFHRILNPFFNWDGLALMPGGHNRLLQERSAMSEVMIRLRTKGLGLAIAGGVAMALSVASPSWAQIDQAEDTADAAVREGAAAQDTINGLDDQTEGLLREYRAVISRLEDMREYNAQQERLIDAQLNELAALQTQIENVTTLQRDVTPLIGRMLDGLREFVALDLPFFEDERTARVERLTELMDRPDVSVAEKFRRVLEAYQIENDYGRTIEATEGTIDMDGQTVAVDYLKIGRIAYFYQTRDQATTAIYDRDAGGWRELSDGYNDEVRIGINMAREIIPPEVLILPVFGPETAE